MSNFAKTLLATDSLASSFGVALNPKLRQAIEADLRFPAKAASPNSQITRDHLADPKVTMLSAPKDATPDPRPSRRQER